MTARFVPPEHADILREYITSHTGGGVVLVMPEAQEAAKSAGIEDGEPIDGYDFGGDADVWVDVITHDGHYAIGESQKAQDND